jgi:hypothetical protein
MPSLMGMPRSSTGSESLSLLRPVRRRIDMQHQFRGGTDTLVSSLVALAAHSFSQDAMERPAP